MKFKPRSLISIRTVTIIGGQPSVSGLKWPRGSLALTELEVVEARCDSVRMRSTCLDVLPEKLSSGDALPLEVFGECFEVLLTACTRGSQKENATHYNTTKIMIRHVLAWCRRVAVIHSYLGSSWFSAEWIEAVIQGDEQQSASEGLQRAHRPDFRLSSFRSTLCSRTLPFCPCWFGLNSYVKSWNFNASV